MLDAVLADVELETVRVVRPGTAGTIEATVLVVHHEDRVDAFRRLPRTLKHAGHTACRTPAGRRMLVLMPRILARRDGPTAERRLAGYCSQHPLFCVIYALR